MKRYFFISLVMVLFLPGWVAMSMADTGSPRGKSAGASLLPDELKSMKVEDYFVESKTTPVGSIQSTTGHVVVIHKDTNRAYFADRGDAVYEQDLFYTLKDSRCRIKFSNEDIITMGENSKVIVDEIVNDQAAQKKSSVISMLKGKAMFYVVRLFKHKTVSASVKTPTAVMGVRGTKFGVDVRKAGEKVADLSDDSFIYLAQNEPGNFETVVYGFDGEVEVTATGGGRTNIVGAGETLVVDSFGAGDVEPMNPNAANQFIQETEGGSGTGWTGGPGGAGLTGGLGGSGWTGGPSWPGGTGGLSWTSWTNGAGAGEGGGGLIGDTGYDPSENVGQNLTFSANDVPLPPPPPPPVEPPPPPPPPPIPPPYVPPTPPPDVPPPATQPWYVNYFTAMLTSIGEGNSFQNLYISDSIQGIGSAVAQAPGSLGGSMTIDGSGGSAQVKVTNIDGINRGEFSDSISGEYIISHYGLGSNANMSWGYWTCTVPMTGSISNEDYLVDNRGYYIFGNNTSNADMSSLADSTAWWSYSGGAEGTYWTNTGTLMGGNFSSKVNFSTGEIQEFNLYVDEGVDGEHFAQVEGASGSFEGTSHFSIYGGTATIGATTTEGDFNAYGSFYGSKAQSMGGVWSIEDISNNKHASGIFHSDTKEELIVNKTGYFTAMLTAYYTSSGYYNDGVFVLNSPIDLRIETGMAATDMRFAISNPNLMRVIDLTAEVPGELGPVQFSSSPPITDQYPITRGGGSSNDYMKWGDWTQTSKMSDGSGHDYWVNNKGYYIEGIPTDISGLNATYTYLGGAEGTYWTSNDGSPGGGIDMTGSFNATVVFSSTPAVTDFDLSVSVGGAEPHSVTITDSTGTFISGGAFSLTGGTIWQLDGANAISKAVYGSVYGSNAEAVGGVWGISSGYGKYATGIFHGEKVIP